MVVLVRGVVLAVCAVEVGCAVGGTMGPVGIVKGAGVVVWRVDGGTSCDIVDLQKRKNERGR